ncbi:MAG TPA: ACP S-malonyltransferase [Terriglobia bacterium]|nr:ACP S-malonyltransferase [Terriglobia bacterium]
MKKAFVFPGQGSQHPGMGRELCEKYPAARQAFQEADDALGFSLSKMCFEGSEEQLQLTENTQPAILTTSIAAFRVLEERGCLPDFVAGHSLGEYSALVAARSLTLADAVVLVRGRGKYMQEAVPIGVGAMAALLGIEPSAARAVCAQAAGSQVVAPANLNSSSQVVIAGHREAVERAMTLAKEAGAKRAIMLSVSAPFHCVLLQPAADRLKHDIDACAFADLRFPLITNVDAKSIETAAAARDSLERQVTMPVRWQESVLWMLARDVRAFVEVGPGKVLLGLIRTADKSAGLFNVEDEKSLENTFSGLL